MKTQISMTQNEAYKEEIFAWVRDEDRRVVIQRIIGYGKDGKQYPVSCMVALTAEELNNITKLF